MTALTSFYPRIIPYLPGCPEPTAGIAVIDACAEFAEATDLFQVTTDPVQINANTNAYDLDLPSGTRLVRVLRAWYGSTPLEIVPSTDVSTPLAYNLTVADSSAVRDTPKLAYNKDSTLYVYPIPLTTTANALTTVLSVAPARSATSVDDTFYDVWVDAICSGAIARLATIPHQSFTDASLAVVHRAEFLRACTKAKIESTRGRAASSVAVKARYF